MKPASVSQLAAAAFDLTVDTDRLEPFSGDCAACGHPIDGLAHNFKAGPKFGDRFLMAHRDADHICGTCDALMRSALPTTGVGSGVVSKKGFERLLSNKERIAFLMEPPEPPFAVAFINAQRQHVWWMARMTYDKDLIAVQFGHRQFTIDRPKAISAARAILDYEAYASARDKKNCFVFAPLSRDLKSTSDGQRTLRFERDEDPRALALAPIINALSLGDLWAAMQIRAATREIKTSCPDEALAAIKTAA